MNNIRVTLSFERLDDKEQHMLENYSHTYFASDEDTYDVHLEKFEQLLTAIGYVLNTNNRHLELVDEENLKDSIVNLN